MTARHELAKRLISMVSAGEPITMDTLNEILKGYTILREADEEKSDLKKRISYYLGLNGSMDCHPAPWPITNTPWICSAIV